MSSKPSKGPGRVAGVWFRKCLRVQDNAALLEACSADHVVPFFVLDPHFDSYGPGGTKVGANRWRFLLDSLADLDRSLSSKYGSRLLVLKGRPETVVKELCGGSGFAIPGGGGKKIQLDELYFEFDSEPYALKRDAAVESAAKKAGVPCHKLPGHTLLDLEAAKTRITTGTPKMNAPSTMQGIMKLVREMTGSGDKLEKVPPPRPAPRKLPALPPYLATLAAAGKAKAPAWCAVPSVREHLGSKEAGVELTEASAALFPGGESEGLKRLQRECSAKLAERVDFVCAFQKPRTQSTNVGGSGAAAAGWEKPHTTGLSPYLKFGCVSPREVWAQVQACYDEGRKKGKKISLPPESLHGQLLFREMFYVLSYCVESWDKNEGNRMCTRPQVPWDAKDAKKLKAWETGQTGYPYIDALMRQLNQTGWMHHLGRHAVACFLTRGDLFQHWVHGRDVFDKLLLDADWALNNGNWLWLAGVAPFSSPYWRVYDPCPGKDSALNAEQTGDFVKHFVPELRGMPAKYIYRPWTAPPEVQKQAKCEIGKDYPAPIVDHKEAREANLARFAAKGPPKAKAQPAAKAAAAGPQKRALPKATATRGPPAKRPRK